MFGVESAEKLHFAICAKQLGNGLDAQLEKFVHEHPDTRLIIIDTLQKVRELSGEAYSYRDDYQIIGQLKQLSDKFRLCMLIVHHTRKSAANDEFDRISGTTGIYGCADGAFVLSKENQTDNAATLSVSGRDQPDQRIHLVRDEERLLWCFDHADNEPYREPPDPLLEKVVVLVTEVTIRIGVLKHRHHRHRGGGVPARAGGIYHPPCYFQSLFLGRSTTGSTTRSSSWPMPLSWSIIYFSSVILSNTKPMPTSLLLYSTCESM